MLRMIAAKSMNSVIGVDGELPWYISADLKKFKELTTDNKKGNNIIVMGRKTWESIGEKPLPNRINVVISRQPRRNCIPRNKEYNKILWLKQPQDVLKHYPDKSDTINIIGGESLYRYFLSLCDELYLTYVYIDIPIEKDKKYSYFPNIASKQWNAIHIGETKYDGLVPFQFDHYIS